MLSQIVALCLLGLTLSVSASDNAELHKRQATRTSVVRRMFAHRVRVTTTLPSPSSQPGTCICVTGYYAGQPCPPYDPDCPGACPDQTIVSKRGIPLFPAPSGFYAPEDHPGALLDPEHAARFFMGQGEFRWDNGTLVRDEIYIARADHLRMVAPLALKFAKIVARAGGGLVRYGAAYFVNYLAGQLQDPDKVMVLSDEWAVRAGDLLPMARLMLADPKFEELEVYHHSIPRNVVQAVVDALCPDLGDQFCGAPSPAAEDFAEVDGVVSGPKRRSGSL